MVSLPLVPSTMTVSACAVAGAAAGGAARSMLTCVTPVPVRSLTMIVVGAAQRVEVDLLDAVEIHGDVGRRRG